MGNLIHVLDFAKMSDGENMKGLIRGGIAEAIGVFLFVFTGCGAAISAGGGLYPIAFAFGLAIMVLVFATADISGGHLNPAVSFSFLVTGMMPPVKFAIYVSHNVSAPSVLDTSSLVY